MDRSSLPNVFLTPRVTMSGRYCVEMVMRVVLVEVLLVVVECSLW